MRYRPLLAAAFAAAALSPLPAAAATTHPPCAFHPICDKLGHAAVSVHGLCDKVEEAAPWLIVCY